MSTTSPSNAQPSTTQPTGGNKASTKAKSDWLAPAILTARTITAAAECAPFPYIKGVSGTVVILLETVQKVKKNREDLKELCDSTTEIVMIIHDQILAHANTAVKFKAMCEELESYLATVILAVQNLHNPSKGFRKRVKELVGSSNMTDEIAGHQKQIQGVCLKLKLLAAVDTNSKVNEMHAIMTAPRFVLTPLSQSINNCPPPSRIFQGRQTVLAKMHKFFTVDSGKQLIYVLHGLGGAGKTQIVLKFIQESSANFSDIFLLDASTLDTINTGLKNIAVSKFVGDSAEDTLTWLQSKHGDWLLFFDNADDPKINLNKFFPQCNHGNIIITSRNPGLRTYGDHSPVSDMEDKDATTLLLQSAAKESSEENVQAAAVIVKELFHLPLAIVQAGSFILQSEDIAGYLTLYQENRARLLSEKAVQSHDHYAWTVYTTWQISFDRLSPIAATLLQLCSFLHYSGISEDMFSNASKYSFPMWLPAKEELQEPFQFLSHFLGPTGEWNSLRFSEVANEIKSYSLITFDAATRMFSIHPLVHAWSRSTLVDEAASHLCISSILGMSIAEILENDMVIASLKLMPHIGSVNPFNADVGADFRVAFWRIYFSAGKFTEAQNLIEQTCKKYRLVFGEEHLATLEAMHRLGLTYSHLGEYKKAKELEVTVLEKRTTLLGQDHPDTLMAMGNLARTYSELGDLEKAKELEVTVLEKRTKSLGEDHTETIRAIANLAVTYYNLEEFTKAGELEVVVLEKRRQLLGDQHPDTILAMKNLISTYRALDKLTEAEELEQLVRQI
ncbi:P-loop containing nucleoside triphosphate hydrolase protein [Mycena alexandri]|uniref:P-loop containing nucleoside triphosphate hydrolase protein n=1 Tax=Mycena alexandri TaxID=1745969 RepID=A0AAD6S4A7_9AGAR|nr:P-loop containing nucleoside triphosphate hydrolase protein [Mycena alexandri]